MLVRAEQICLQLLVYPDVPAEVKDILIGKNEAMMTPNVEKTDPFLMAHSRHMVHLLDGCGLGKASSPLQTSNLTACDTDESIHVLPSDNESTEGSNETRMNDLDRASSRSGRAQVARESNEVQMNDSDDEIVVLSEEAQNIF